MSEVQAPELVDYEPFVASDAEPIDEGDAPEGGYGGEPSEMSIQVDPLSVIAALETAAKVAGALKAVADLVMPTIRQWWDGSHEKFGIGECYVRPGETLIHDMRNNDHTAQVLAPFSLAYNQAGPGRRARTIQIPNIPPGSQCPFAVQVYNDNGPWECHAGLFRPAPNGDINVRDHVYMVDFQPQNDHLWVNRTRTFAGILKVI